MSHSNISLLRWVKSHISTLSPSYSRFRLLLCCYRWFSSSKIITYYSEDHWNSPFRVVISSQCSEILWLHICATLESLDECKYECASLDCLHGSKCMLKLHCSECSSEVKDTTDVGVFCSRYRTRSFVKTRSIYRVLSSEVLIIMAWSQAPYIHIILADVVSITWYLVSH